MCRWDECAFDLFEVVVAECGGDEPGFEDAGGNEDPIIQQCVEEGCEAVGFGGGHVGVVVALAFGESDAEHVGGALDVVGDAFFAEGLGDEVVESVGVGVDGVVDAVICELEAGKSCGDGDGVSGEGASLVDGALGG